MKFIRKHASLALAILSIAAVGYRLFQSFLSREWDNPQDEMVARWDERLQPLREALPSGLDQIGYVDTSMVTGDPSAFDGEEFFLMQYSVAPVALDVGVRQEWIIGNFNNDVDFRGWLETRVGKYEIQSFGFGLYLIHKLDP
ncbi:MAG: hypothetical protein HND47_06820 [Chloroflexi bacterium]|nr:hypothetical protein [Chloroflexota bacterium]